MGKRTQIDCIRCWRRTYIQSGVCGKCQSELEKLIEDLKFIKILECK